MNRLRYLIVLVMLLNTSCTVILPSPGDIVNYKTEELDGQIRCRAFALSKEPAAPDIPEERYDDDDYVIQKLGETVALQKKWIDETRRRLLLACGKI